MSAPVGQAQRLQFLSATEDASFSKEVGIDETLSSELWGFDETSMSRENEQSETHMRAVMSNTVWNALYPALRSLASYLVHTSPLPYWHGQEDDMAEDIVQETVRRVIERAQKAERDEAPPIESLRQMATTVAYNYYRDLKRHDYRLSHLDTTDTSVQAPYVSAVDVLSGEYLLDAVVDKVDQDCLFDRLAGQIACFPPKQKQAILIDLANRMSFDEESTPLQQSFLKVGIELRHYRQPLPDDPRERGRHVSLCSQAYKRVAHLSASSNAVCDTKEQTSAFVTDQTSTSDPKERIETNMMPLVQNPDQPIQTEDMADTLMQVNTNEDIVTQSPNIIFLISTLPEPYRKPLHMHIIEKETYQKIANCMGLPIGTVKSHVSRGKKLLQKSMDTKDGAGQKIKKGSGEVFLSIEHVNQIPQPYRTVLRLHYVEKQTYAAIASSLQMPIGTVKSYINRGKKFLSGAVS